MIIDSFSGLASDLKGSQRTSENVLAVLAKHPRVSTWSMSEHVWLRDAIKELKHRRLIIEQDESYPWHRYSLTDAGRALLRSNAEKEA